MIIKTKVDNVGDVKSYVHLPVTKRLTFNSLDTSEGQVIGIVQEAVEVDDKIELTIHVWDRFVSQNIEYELSQPIHQPITFSISID